MGRISNLDDTQLDDLFAGQPTRGESAEIARHLAGARSQLVQAPSPAVRDRHLAAMAEAARIPRAVPAGSSAPDRRTAVRLRAAAVKLGAGATALSLSTAGLAYAGVDLPGRAAERAFEVVGIHLPNQGTDKGAVVPDEQVETSSAGKSVAEDVKAVIEGSDLTGCDFGQGVAAAASQNRQNEGGSTEDRCAKGSAAGATGAEERSGGKAKADEAPRGGKSTGDERSAAGKARAAENKLETSGRAEGKGKADEAGSSGGREKGEAASSEARERGRPEKSAPSLPDVVDSVKTERGGGKPEGTGKS